MRVLALIVVALAVAPAAAAKEGVTAELTSTIPTDVQPGTQIDVSWTLTTRDGTPFGAMGVFVRILAAGGGKPVDATAPESHGPFTATVRVPAGGIGGIKIGLHGTTDVFFPLKNNPFAYRRPLHLPKVARGAPCPVSQVDETAPVYPVGRATALRLAPAGNFESKRWGGQKVLWKVAPSYTGPVLVRGRRLDAKGDVRFDSGDLPPKELFIPRGPGDRDRPSSTRLASPGCYAYQVDGFGFSTIVVFRAVRG